MLAPNENRAAVLGPSRFDWWPDWAGRAVAIVGCGPSAKKAGVEHIRGKMPVLAIKEAAVDLCPWADVVYGCDAPWWVHRQGLPKFKGLKLCWDKHVPTQFPDVKTIEIKPAAVGGPYFNRLLLDEPGVIGAGHNSGFQAINLAMQFGAKRILLIGFDMNDQGGEHYYGRNNWFRANNPDTHQFDRCLKAFDENVGHLAGMGVEVVNASSTSSIRGLAKMTVPVALAAWGLT